MRTWPLIALILGLTLLPAACGPTQLAPEAGKSPAMAITSSPSPLSTLDELVKAAQREGSVNIYAIADTLPVVEPVRKGFGQKYGISLEFTRGMTNEVIAKITAERRAALYLADLSLLGETASTTIVKPLGITVPLDDLLFLPEVKDPQNWLGGKFPFLDKDRNVLMFSLLALSPLIVNTDLVNEGALSSFTDLVKPEWKGKIVVGDPTIGMPSTSVMGVMYEVYGKERALELFRQLAANQPAITRDARLQVEWVARGKYAVGLGYYPGNLIEFKQAQAPIRPLSLKEPRSLTGGSSSLMVYNNNPHPKATQLFINWLLSKEGAAVWSQALGYASARVDLTREGLGPDIVPRAGDLFPTQERIDLRFEMRKIGADIFGSLLQ